MKLLFPSTSAEVTPVIKLDGEPVNDGKVGPNYTSTTRRI